MKLVSEEDVEKAWLAWEDWKVCYTTGQFNPTRYYYYLYLEIRRRYETG